MVLPFLPSPSKITEIISQVSKDLVVYEKGCRQYSKDFTEIITEWSIKNQITFFHSTVAWWCFPGQIWNRSLLSLRTFWKLFFHVEGEWSHRTHILLLWHCRSAVEVQRWQGTCQGGRKRWGWARPSMVILRCSVPVPSSSPACQGEHQTLPPGPSFPGSRKELWFLWGTTGFTVCPHLSCDDKQRSVVGTNSLWLLVLLFAPFLHPRLLLSDQLAPS